MTPIDNSQPYRICFILQGHGFVSEVDNMKQYNDELKFSELVKLIVDRIVESIPEVDINNARPFVNHMSTKLWQHITYSFPKDTP